VLLGGDTVVLTQMVVTLINNIYILIQVVLIITQFKNKTKWHIFIYSNPIIIIIFFF